MAIPLSAYDDRGRPVRPQSGFEPVDVYDVVRQEWRVVEIVPYQPDYRLTCGNGLHQMRRGSRARCACGQMRAA